MAFPEEVVHPISAMGRLGSIILLSAAAIGVLALPTAAYLFIHGKPDTWLQDLSSYQSLAGGLATLFAAGLATIGVWINVLTQRDNVKRQIQAQQESIRQQIQAQQEAIRQQIQSNADRAREDWLEQRKEAAYLRHLEMQHLAAAFIGEITVMLKTFRGVSIDPAAAVNTTEAETLKVVLIGVFRGEHLILFEKNADKIGVFPADVVSRLTALYSKITTIGEIFKSPSVEAWPAEKVAEFVREGSEEFVENMKLAESLLEAFEKIRIQPFDASPYEPRHPTPQSLA